MRRLAFVLALFALGACASAPPPKPVAPPPPPKPQGPAFELTDLSSTAETLSAVALDLSGTLRKDVEGGELSWTATVGGRDAGHGKKSLAGSGPFQLSIPASFGSTLADLEPFQSSDTVSVIVNATFTSGGKTYSDQRAVDLRSPLLPTVRILNMETSQPQSDQLALSFRVGISNSDPWDIQVGKMTYAVTLDGHSLASTSLDVTATLPAGGARYEFELPVAADASNCGKDFDRIVRAQQLPWTFTGTLSVGKLLVPFNLNGTTQNSNQ